MNNHFTIINEPPNPTEYNDLRLEGGISGKSKEAATVGVNYPPLIDLSVRLKWGLEKSLWLSSLSLH